MESQKKAAAIQLPSSHSYSVGWQECIIFPEKERETCKLIVISKRYVHSLRIRCVCVYVRVCYNMLKRKVDNYTQQ